MSWCPSSPSGVHEWIQIAAGLVCAQCGKAEPKKEPK